MVIVDKLLKLHVHHNREAIIPIQLLILCLTEFSYKYNQHVLQAFQLKSTHFSFFSFCWLTVLSVEPLVQYVVCLSVVCLSSVCDVLYCGKTVRPSQKVSEGVNRKPGSKRSFFWVAAIFLLPVSPLRPPIGPFLPYVLWRNGTS